MTPADLPQQPDGPALPGTPETIVVGGFSRPRYLIVLLLIAGLAGLWVLLTQGKWNGVGALIVLPIFAVAVWFTAGPPDRLRRVVLGPEGIELTRHTLVRTRIAADELAEVRRDEGSVVLVPLDLPDFLTRHRELRPLRQGAQIRLPLS